VERALFAWVGPLAADWRGGSFFLAKVGIPFPSLGFFSMAEGGGKGNFRKI